MHTDSTIVKSETSSSKKLGSPTKKILSMKLSFPSKSSSSPPPSLGSPVQQVEHLHDLQNEQTKRIAEHNTMSDLEVRLMYLLHKAHSVMSEPPGGVKQEQLSPEKNSALQNQVVKILGMNML